MKNFKIGWLLSLVITVVVTCDMYGASQSIQLSFDSLFPASVYKKALDCLMQIRGGFVEWYEQKDHQEASGSSLSLDISTEDLLVGQLANLQDFINNLGKQVAIVSRDDIEYLSSLVTDTVQNYYNYYRVHEPDVARNTDALFISIQDRLEQILN